MTSMELPYWLSWWHEVTLMSEFELHTPWWQTGRRDFAKESYAISVVAAVRADSFAAAKALVVASYDETPVLEWRFIEEKPRSWSPFCERFPRAEWMKW